MEASRRRSGLNPQCWALALALALAFSGSACAAPIALVGTHAIPAARGELRLSTGDNGNTSLRLKVAHLAPPSQVTDGTRAYVVWVQSVDHVAPPQNVGELRVDDDLNGLLETVTPLRSFDLTVTAEISAQVNRPMGQPLLSARAERP